MLFRSRKARRREWLIVSWNPPWSRGPDRSLDDPARDAIHKCIRARREERGERGRAHDDVRMVVCERALGSGEKLRSPENRTIACEDLAMKRTLRQAQRSLPFRGGTGWGLTKPLSLKLCLKLEMLEKWSLSLEGACFLICVRPHPVPPLKGRERKCFLAEAFKCDCPAIRGRRPCLPR